MHVIFDVAIPKMAFHRKMGPGHLSLEGAAYGATEVVTSDAQPRRWKHVCPLGSSINGRKGLLLMVKPISSSFHIWRRWCCCYSFIGGLTTATIHCIIKGLSPTLQLTVECLEGMHLEAPHFDMGDIGNHHHSNCGTRIDIGLRKLIVV